MSYSSINRCNNDSAFIGRLTACIADEGAADPYAEVNRIRWIVCAADDIESAYEFGINSNNPDPGGDPTVITDAMILSVVQANPAPPPEAA
jgi:hypothetical protein